MLWGKTGPRPNPGGFRQCVTAASFDRKKSAVAPVADKMRPHHINSTLSLSLQQFHKYTRLPCRAGKIKTLAAAVLKESVLLHQKIKT